jgi:Zn-dependent protease
VENARIAGVPLRVSEAFLVVALLLGFLVGRQVAGTRLVRIPRIDSVEEALHVFDPGGPLEIEIRPSIGWALAAGAGVALVYALSVVAHELGHLVAARRAGAGVGEMRLHAAGGYVEVDDNDDLTAGRIAAIAAAGPLVTAVLALALAAVLTALGWPLTGMPVEGSAAAAAAGRVLSAAFALNVAGVVINLLPFRPLDGGQLVLAAKLRRARSGR